MKHFSGIIVLIGFALAGLLEFFERLWNHRRADILPDPHRSVKREAELQHEQFAYIARIKREG